jgi:phosphatidylglycerol:prolipoprotein diacylglycerol transferase
MQPILIQWGGLTIGSYAAFMSLGLIAAVAVVAIEARRLHVRSGIYLDAVLAAITVGVLTARLGYVAVNWAYFKDHAWETFALWEGGLSWQTGLVGGSIAAWLIAHQAIDHSPGQILDLLALGAPLGMALAWIGCYLAAAAYGKELFPGDPFFSLAVDMPDLYGATNPRWPSQLLGIAWSLVVFGMLWLTRQHAWPIGRRYWLFVAVYSLGAVLIGFTRGDDVPLLAGWRLDQLFDAALVISATLSLVWLRSVHFSLGAADKPFAKVHRNRP